MLCVICENGWCALYEVHACAYTDRSNSTAETGVLICSKHRRLRRRHNIAWECCNDFLAYLSHLPIRNQEPRDRNLHQHHFVWLHRHTNKSFQKTEPIKTASEKWRNREREREIERLQQIDQEQLFTNRDCPCFMFSDCYHITAVRMQCIEATSRSSREPRPDRDACRTEQFLEMVLEELGSSICGSTHNKSIVLFVFSF